MESQTHARILSANQMLREFLRRAEGLANRNGTATERDLKKFSLRLVTLAPEIGDASRAETLDAGLQREIAEYVKNFRALQGALEKVRCFVLARQVQLEAVKRRTEVLQDWVDLRPQTT